MNWSLFWTLLLQIVIALIVLAVPASFFTWMVWQRFGVRSQRSNGEKIL